MADIYTVMRFIVFVYLYSVTRIQIMCLISKKFVVAEGHNIFEVTERLFAAGGNHSSLWPKATTFEKSQV